MMMHEHPVDVYRIAEHAKRQVSIFTYGVRLTGYRCLPILRDHPKKDELLNVLIDAGESAWARGAHEVDSYSSWLVEANLFVIVVIAVV